MFHFQRFIEESIEASKILDLPKPQKTSKSFGVLDRFVPKLKK